MMLVAFNAISQNDRQKANLVYHVISEDSSNALVPLIEKELRKLTLSNRDTLFQRVLNINSFEKTLSLESFFIKQTTLINGGLNNYDYRDDPLKEVSELLSTYDKLLIINIVRINSIFEYQFWAYDVVKSDQGVSSINNLTYKTSSAIIEPSKNIAAIESEIRMAVKTVFIEANSPPRVSLKYEETYLGDTLYVFQNESFTLEAQAFDNDSRQQEISIEWSIADETITPLFFLNQGEFKQHLVPKSLGSALLEVRCFDGVSYSQLATIRIISIQRSQLQDIESKRTPLINSEFKNIAFTHAFFIDRSGRSIPKEYPSFWIKRGVTNKNKEKLIAYRKTSNKVGDSIVVSKSPIKIKYYSSDRRWIFNIDNLWDKENDLLVLFPNDHGPFYERATNTPSTSEVFYNCLFFTRSSFTKYPESILLQSIIGSRVSSQIEFDINKSIQSKFTFDIGLGKRVLQNSDYLSATGLSLGSYYGFSSNGYTEKKDGTYTFRNQHFIYAEWGNIESLLNAGSFLELSLGSHWRVKDGTLDLTFYGGYRQPLTFFLSDYTLAEKGKFGGAIALSFPSLTKEHKVFIDRVIRLRFAYFGPLSSLTLTYSFPLIKYLKQ